MNTGMAISRTRAMRNEAAFDPKTRVLSEIHLEGSAFFQAVNEVDIAQTAGVWAAAVAVLFLAGAAPSVAALRVILAALFVWLFGLEARNFMSDDRLVLRGKTAVLIGFYGYIFMTPILGPKWMYEVPIQATYTAAALCLVFLAIAMTVYCSVTGRRYVPHGFLENCVQELDVWLSFKVLMFCFWPCVLVRIYLQNWSGGASITEGIFGLRSAPWGRGQFGDWRVIFMPTDWLYSLVPAISAVCWVKASKSPPHRVAVAVIWAFVFITLMLQRSRAMLVVSVATVLAVLLFTESRRSARLRIYLTGIALVPVLIICSNLILSNRQTGNVARFMLEERDAKVELNANPMTVLEDNLQFFAGVAKVVPERVDFRSPSELYYFLAINPIPRFLWPDKPYMSQKYLGQVRPEYAAVTCVAEMYIYGGWLHVLLGAIVFGYLLKRADLFGKTKIESETGRLVIYLSLILVFFGTIRGMWSLMWGLYPVITLLAILYTLKAMRPGGPQVIGVRTRASFGLSNVKAK